MVSKAGIVSRTSMNLHFSLAGLIIGSAFLAILSLLASASALPLPDANEAPTSVWNVTSGTYTDETAAAFDVTADDVSCGFGNIGDAHYIGHERPFDTIVYNVTTAGSGGTVAWEYWDGGDWATISVTDGTSGFTANGIRSVHFDHPVDWNATELCSTSAPGYYYYVRARTSSAFSTLPLAQMASIRDVSNPDRIYYYDGTYNDQTTEGNGLDTPNDTLLGSATVDDILYVGSDPLFSEVVISIGTADNGGSIAWEYWDGTTWHNLVVTDATSAFSVSGLRQITFTPPANWSVRELDSSTAPGNFHYIRAKTTTSYSTAPLANQISVVSYNLQISILKMDGTTGLGGLAETAVSFSGGTDNLPVRFLEGNGGQYLFQMKEESGTGYSYNITATGYITTSAAQTSSISFDSLRSLAPVTLSGDLKIIIYRMDGVTKISGNISNVTIFSNGGHSSVYAPEDKMETGPGEYRFTTDTGTNDYYYSINVTGYVLKYETAKRTVTSGTELAVSETLQGCAVITVYGSGIIGSRPLLASAQVFLYSDADHSIGVTPIESWNSSGAYKFALPPGTYHYVVKSAGYLDGQESAPDVVTAGIETRSNITLPKPAQKLLLILPGESLSEGISGGKTGIPSIQVAGSSFDLVVYAVDSSYWIDRTASATVSLTSSDSNAVLPGSAVLVNGQKVFSVTLRKAGSQDITASDADASPLTSYTTPKATISPASLAYLCITLPGESFTPGIGNSGSPVSIEAGVAFSVRITATDIYHNINTSYSGAKALSFAGPGSSGGLTPVYPGSITFTSGNATDVQITLYRVESVSITTYDGGNYGHASSQFNVKDTYAPVNPSWISALLHSTSTWSNINEITAVWETASDNGSGIDGYSFLWDRSPGSIPDSTVDCTTNTTTSFKLADGNNWYFHLRVFDRSGNANSTVLHLGPFYIDTAAPANPTSSSALPVSIWSTQSQISVCWTSNPGSDGSGTSGVAGYSFVWDTNPSTLPDQVSEGMGTTNTSPALNDGKSHYFHIRILDTAGNWNGTAYHLGPFWTDSTPPTNPNPASITHSVKVWSNNTTITIDWSGQAGSDQMSGIGGYSYVWDTNSGTLPDTTSEGTMTIFSQALAEGMANWFHIRARDTAGNWIGTAVHLGPFYIDSTAPIRPTSNLTNPAAWTWTNVNIIDAQWWGATDALSGVDGYSFLWTTNAGQTPDNTLEGSDNSTTSQKLADGTWYLLVRVRDRAGNWNTTTYRIEAFKIDTVAPSNPTPSSSTHSISTWSTQTQITVSWASNPGSDGSGTSGVAGYSFVWDTNPSTLPDDVSEGTGTSTISTALNDGKSHYFHIRILDTAGNWNGTAIHLGPFWTDSTPPTNPNPASTSHSVKVWSNNTTITIDWSGQAGSDQMSGIGGYSYEWDTNSGTLPNTTSEGTMTIFSQALVEGMANWFHIRARDTAGNWIGTAVHLGPFYIDTIAPSLPNNNLTTPIVWIWTNVNIIDAQWWGATDALSGVDGYSFLWTTNAGQAPDNLLEGTANSSTSQKLADGTWYLLIRVRDNAGNWNNSVYTIGAFEIDTIAPSNPVPASGIHVITTWSTQNQISVSWASNPGSDGSGTSGVAGYSFVWDTNPSTLPDDVSEGTGTSTISTALNDGKSHYFHIRILDKAGNWNGTAYHLGPFWIDSTPPSNPNPTSTTHSVNVWSNSTTVTVDWSGQAGSDQMSGIGGYSYVWDTNSGTLPDTISEGTTTIYSRALAEGLTNWFHIRARDTAGNWIGTAVHLGPFYIDSTAPSLPTSNLTNPAAWTWTNVNIIDAQWWNATDALSGVDGYSFLWTTNAGQAPDNLLEGTANSSTSQKLADGTWYLLVRVRDNAGNWNNSVYTIGAFEIDTIAPSNPVPASGTHVISTWSTQTQISVSWASNPGSDGSGTSGVAGYSFVWDTNPSTLPDEVSDGSGTSTISASLNDGKSYYFHIRILDKAGNWNGTAYHLGPFWIDCTHPTNPIPVSSSHVKNVWSNSSTIAVDWSSAPGSDLMSGIGGYTYEWNNDSSTSLVSISDIENDTSDIFNVPSDGIYWFHIRAVDKAGNWIGATVHLGPFKIDRTPPESPRMNSTNIKAWKWTTENFVKVIWEGSPDAGSDVGGYSIHWSQLVDDFPDELIDTTAPTLSQKLDDGIWYLTIRVVDRAGNWNASTYVIGAFWIDSTAPVNPIVSSSTHSISTLSNLTRISVEWTATPGFDGTSHLAGYSYCWDNSPNTIPDDILEIGGTIAFQASPSEVVANWFHIRAKDNAGNWAGSTVHLGPFLINTEKPTGSFLINGGKGYTNDQLVTLTLNFTHRYGIKEIRISNSKDFQNWQTLSPAQTITWDIGRVDGIHVVFLSVIGAPGTSLETSQSITLVTEKPEILSLKCDVSPDSDEARISGQISRSGYPRMNITAWLDDKELAISADGSFQATVKSRPLSNEYHLVIRDETGNTAEKTMKAYRAPTAVSSFVDMGFPWLLLFLLVALIAVSAMTWRKVHARPVQQEITTAEDVAPEQAQCAACGAPVQPGESCAACATRFEAEDLLVKALHSDLEIEDRARIALSISSAIRSISAGNVDDGSARLERVRNELEASKNAPRKTRPAATEERRFNQPARTQEPQPMQYIQYTGTPDLTAEEDSQAPPASIGGALTSEETFELVQDDEDAAPSTTDMSPITPAYSVPAVVAHIPPVAPKPRQPPAGLLGGPQGPPLGMIVTDIENESDAISLVNMIKATGVYLKPADNKKDKIRGLIENTLDRAATSNEKPLLLLVRTMKFGESAPSAIIEDIGALAATGALGEGPDRALLPVEASTWRYLVGLGSAGDVRLIASEGSDSAGPIADALQDSISEIDRKMLSPARLRMVGLSFNGAASKKDTMIKVLEMITGKLHGK